jgi:hypothetical protein
MAVLTLFTTLAADDGEPQAAHKSTKEELNNRTRLWAGAKKATCSP